MSSFILATGIAVMDERSFKNRLQDIANRVVNNAIAERGGADHPALRLEDLKRSVSARLVSVRNEFALKLNQQAFAIKKKPSDIGLPPFTA